MRIVLVGGAGFIGHHLAVALRCRGDEVTVIDSLAVNNYYSLLANKDHDYAAPYLAMVHERLDLLDDVGVPVIRMDARDYNQLSMAIGPLHPDCIVHLAAVTHLAQAQKSPYSTLDHSLRTLENALDVACAVGKPHFIYFSSSTVYGDFATPEVTEDSPVNPKGVYAATKYAGELIVRAYAHAHELPFTIIRPSALYGPRCVSRRVAQIFIERAQAGQDLQIQGTGQEKHDFTYIDDLVFGTTGIISNQSEMVGQTFNITAGDARSVLELCGQIQRFYPGISVQMAPHDGITPNRGTLNVSKAKDVFGYVPQFNLERGIAKYVQWYRTLPYFPKVNHAVDSKIGQGPYEKSKEQDQSAAVEGRSQQRLVAGA